MSNLSDYYRDLLRWEGKQHRQLVHEWPHELRDMVELAFVNAVSESSIKGSSCPIKPHSTNQSRGNQVEKYTIKTINSAISGFSILKCSGPGYPDQNLIQQILGCSIPLEVKATKDWNEKDSNRRVLTSSSKKLRAQFSDPIYHLILTVLYMYHDGEKNAKIDTIRLDFLEPSTTVNVRLEASVNHKILANGPHRSTMI